MIWIEQANAAGDDAMTVMIGVAGEGDVEAVLERDQAGHGVRRRAIHADAAIPVDGHEAERGVHLFVDDVERQLVVLGDAWPVINARATQRVDTDLQSGAANRIHVDDRREVGYISADVVVPAGRAAAQGA